MDEENKIFKSNLPQDYLHKIEKVEEKDNTKKDKIVNVNKIEKVIYFLISFS